MVALQTSSESARFHFLHNAKSSVDLLSLFLCLFVLEANPAKFNSRFRNKMFYAGVSATPYIYFFLYLCYGNGFR